MNSDQAENCFTEWENTWYNKKRGKERIGWRVEDFVLPQQPGHALLAIIFIIIILCFVHLKKTKTSIRSGSSYTTLVSSIHYARTTTTTTGEGLKDWGWELVYYCYSLRTGRKRDRFKNRLFYFIYIFFC